MKVYSYRSSMFFPMGFFLFVFFIFIFSPFSIPSEGEHTGVITATGGAWNTSIVAEYISYNGQVWTTPGLGSSVSLAAQEGNIPLLVGSVLVMVATVALWNYFVWLRLYHYSEKRFSLNY